MNRTIWKYPLRVTDENHLSAPHGAIALDVQLQDGLPVLWMLVNPAAPKVPRTVFTFGTGYPADLAEVTLFVATYQLDNGLVFHTFIN